jgi:hypothetical protein
VVVLSFGPIEWIASIAVAITMFVVPVWVASRGKTGEARFDKDGKVIDDEYYRVQRSGFSAKPEKRW